MATESTHGMESAAAWTIATLIKWAAGYFEKRGIDAPRLTAELLLGKTLSMDRVALYLRHDQPLDPAELSLFKTLVLRRVKGEPTAYILGRREFWSRSFLVDRRVLIPRPETEHLVEAALALLPENPAGRPLRVLDLGTGSGAIVVTLAAERPGHLFFASDKSADAIAVARENAHQHGVSGAIRFFVGRWFEPLREGSFKWDLIVSNPPYIATGAIGALQVEVAGNEPISALDGGPDGLAALRAIVDGAVRHLAPGGTLLLEMGHDQAGAVRRVAEGTHAFFPMETVRDLSGIERVARLCRL